MSRSSPELKQKVWRGFARAVAELHRKNILRGDIDDVQRVTYNPASDAVSFRPAPVVHSAEVTPVAADQLARNLVPLMQFVFRNREADQAVGVWRAFEQVYLEVMDERGPDVISTLHVLRRNIQEASQLNMKALGLAYVGKLDEAESTFQQVLQIREENGDHEGYCRTLCTLALMHADKEEFDRAEAVLDEAIERARAHSRFKGWALALFQRGLLLSRHGERAGALRQAELAILTWQQTALPLPQQFAALYESLGGNLADLVSGREGTVFHGQ